jgi:hypothetical protein
MRGYSPRQAIRRRGSDADTCLVPEETVVRSSCVACGTVDMPADAVTVLLPAGGGTPRYRFACPGCAASVDKPTSHQAVLMLRNAGAVIVIVPAEVTERCAPGAALTNDDLIDFARALADSDDLARLASG